MITINGVTQPTLPPVYIKVPEVMPAWYNKIFIKMKLRKPDKLFTICAQSLNSVSRIGKLMKKIDIPDGYFTDNEHLPQKMHAIIEQHRRTIGVIITIAIENRQKKPCRATVNYLLQNMSTDNLHMALNIVVHQMDISSLLRAMAALKGLQIFRSPDNPEEN